MSARKIAIFGATSAIAQAVARRYADRGAELFVAARDDDKLASVAGDLEARGAARVGTLVADALDDAAPARFLDEAVSFLGRPDAVLIAHGTLPDNDAVRRDGDAVAESFRVNALSAIALATRFAAWFEEVGGGTVAVIGSVAGDRARPSNYVYGAAKGAVDLYLEGMRHKLADTGVRIVTIKPGFVDTPMTAHLPKGLLFASPARVAAGIERAIDRGVEVAYVPGFWRPILFVIRCLPGFVIRRTGI